MAKNDVQTSVSRPRAGIGSEFGLSRFSGYQLSLHGGDSPLHGTDFVLLTANGRVSLGLAGMYAQQVDKTQRDTVLLPSYLCDSMIQPFTELGLRVRFYRVNKNLSIGTDDVYKHVDEHTLAVVLMHYFGFKQNEGLATRISNEFPELTIIDDRTHLLLTDLHAKSFSNSQAVGVYSVRKWGPFPDLGIVVWPGLKKDDSLGRSPSLGPDLRFSAWRLLGLFLRTLFVKWPFEVLRRLSLWSLHQAEDILERRVRFRKASFFSRLLWHFWDWKKGWYIRRENFQYLLDNWPDKIGQPLFKKLPDDVCPIGFPISVHRREELKSKLINKQIYPPIHWRRPPEVSPQLFPDADSLANEELTLPIDQRYNTSHMKYILEVLCGA